MQRKTECIIRIPYKDIKKYYFKFDKPILVKEPNNSPLHGYEEKKPYDDTFSFIGNSIFYWSSSSQ